MKIYHKPSARKPQPSAPRRHSSPSSGTLTGRINGSGPLDAIEKIAEAANRGDRLVVIVVEQGPSGAECCLCPWSAARETLRRAAYGTAQLSEKQKREEQERWQLFADVKTWSVDADNRPFGREVVEKQRNIRAYFLTSPDVLFMRRAG